MSADDPLQRAYAAGWNAAMAYRDGLERLALALRTLALDERILGLSDSAPTAASRGMPRLRIVETNALDPGFAD